MNGYNSMADLSDELTALYSAIGKIKRFQICSQSDLAEYSIDLNTGTKEKVWVVGVDSQNRIIGKKVFEGTVDHATVYPRDVFTFLMEIDASAFFLIHNHPAGSSEFSDADVRLTKRLYRAGEGLGIELQDHGLHYGSGFSSMRSTRFWQGLK